MIEHNPDSHCARILKHLQRAPITPIDALRDHGCFRLAARISDLRQDGHNINMQMMKQNNRRFAQYTLVVQ